MLWVVAPPGVQVLPLALLEVRVTLPPAQNDVGPLGVMVGVAGKGLTVTVMAFEGARFQAGMLAQTLMG